MSVGLDDARAAVAPLTLDDDGLTNLLTEALMTALEKNKLIKADDILKWQAKPFAVLAKRLAAAGLTPSDAGSLKVRGPPQLHLAKLGRCTG